MPQIPSPLMMPNSPQRRQDPLTQLLLALAGSAGQQLIGRGLDRALPQQFPERPPPQATIAQEADMLGAERFLRESGRAGGEGFLPPDLAREIAQANDLDLIEDREEVLRLARVMAPERAALVKAETEAFREQEAQAASIAEAKALLGTGPNAAALQNAFDVQMAMSATGMSVEQQKAFVEPFLPESEKDKVDLALAKLELGAAETEEATITVATNRLVAMGILPEGTPPMSTAPSLLNAAIEQQLGERINWEEQLVNFVLDRIGESPSGTNMAFFQAGAPMPSGGTGELGVSVDEAVNQGLEAMRRLAPPGALRMLEGRLEAGRIDALVKQGVAANKVREIIQMDPNTAEAEILGALKEQGFTDSVARQILQRGRETSGLAQFTTEEQRNRR